MYMPAEAMSYKPRAPFAAVANVKTTGSGGCFICRLERQDPFISRLWRPLQPNSPRNRLSHNLELGRSHWRLGIGLFFPKRKASLEYFQPRPFSSGCPNPVRVRDAFQNHADRDVLHLSEYEQNVCSAADKVLLSNQDQHQRHIYLPERPPN